MHDGEHILLKIFCCPFSIGYRLRWRSDIWSTNRGAAEVGTPDIRPTTEDDIRHNATTRTKTFDHCSGKDTVLLVVVVIRRCLFEYEL